MSNTTSSNTPVFGNSHGYWLRCGVAIQECFKGACLDILLHPGVCGLPDNEKQLYALLIVFKRNEYKRLKNVIKQYQWEILCHVCDKNCPAPCPKKGRTSIDELDITLICVLIKNIDKIVVTFNLALLKKILPYIEDARKIRNSMMHADPAILLSCTKDFHDLWLKIEQTLKGLSYQHMNRFHNLKHSPLEPYTTQKLDWLNTCYKELSLTKCDKTELTRLEAHVTEMNKCIQEIRLTKCDKTEMTRLEAMVNETKKELKTDMTTRLEAMMMKDVQQDESAGEELKEKYRKKYDRINLPLNPNTTSFVCNDVIDREEIIVDLSMVPRTSSVFDTACDNQQITRLRKQQKEIASDTASTTDYSEIVSSKDDYVIISGVPGSGKTTLVQTILYKWSLGELWHEFDYAFVIYLRDLVRFKNQDDITANKMLTYYYPCYNIAEIAKSSKAILILEGFDELYGKTDLCSKEEEYTCYTRSIHDLLDPQNPSLPFTRLVTSRPGSCPILLKTVLCDNTDLKIFLVTGFSEQSIHRYVKNHFREKDQADAVVHRLKNVSVVYDSMVVPFNCWGVCYLIKNDIPIEEFGQTETSLYANLLTLFIRNHGLRNTKIKLKDVHAHPKFKEICVGLAALAFQLEQTNKINFSAEDFPAGVSIQTLVEDSGMIIEIDGEIDTSYQFLHYTFHEFFVALHMMFSGQTGENHIILENMQVGAMLAGLLGGLAVESKSDGTLKRISKLFDTPKTESVNIANVIGQVSYISELLRLVYEFHNPITSDIHILDLTVVTDRFKKSHVEYFKKLCADKKVHFRITQLIIFSYSDMTIIRSLLRCSEYKNLSLRYLYESGEEEWCKIVEENHFEKITLKIMDGTLTTESLLSACLHHCSKLEFILRRESFDSVINNLLVVQQRSNLNITVTRLVIIVRSPFEYTILNILNAFDICQEVVIRTYGWIDLEQYVDECDQLIREQRRFKVLKKLRLEGFSNSTSKEYTFF